MRLQNKINLYTTVLFIILLIMMNLFVYFVSSYMIIDSEMQRIRAETEKMVESMNESLNIIPTEELLRAYVPVDGMVRVVTQDKKAFSPVTSSTEKELSKLKKTFYIGEKSEKITFHNKTYAFISIPIIWTDEHVVNLQVVRSIQPSIAILHVLRMVLIIITIIAMVPVILSSRFLSRFITRPVTSMIETMTEIRKSGQFKRIQVNHKSKDELVEMGDTFNHMIDLLEANFVKQEQFVSNASHELNTPLTIIESYASLLKRRGQVEPDIFRESVEAIHSEAVQMKELIEQLLLLAKHNEKWNIKKSKVNVAELVQHSVQSFKKAYHREIKVIQEGGYLIHTDEQKLRQLLFIILDNARKYSDQMIKVYIGSKQQKCVIQISDQGVGISKEDLTKVFDRFYRVDKARTRSQGGTGLGLSIAKEIANVLGATLDLESEEKKGTTVTIALPMN
ncbi:HAMP domain-containing histidine kinase [Bacillus sp. Gen3]|uniref:sensor histidine kinase n=1 Tax=Heyndrickxia oleronia TaxID=38875 RepID=UPI0015D32885|nr:HAMP domain-containing sensor histidine kinase [Heyndrickxia oleronia]MBU5212715.1 HAMP domain-containing histidine kinase [Heyndrickxia oleronia]NYV63888.1 HAMP domain-containing histidine kinase [Bacillus sp. Gen3]